MNKKIYCFILTGLWLFTSASHAANPKQIAHLQRMIVELQQRVMELEEQSVQERISALQEEQVALRESMDQLLNSKENSTPEPTHYVETPPEPEVVSEEVASPLLIGLLAIQVGDAQQAAEAFAPFLQEKSPQIPTDILLFLLGNAFFNQENHERAAYYYGALVRGFPNSELRPKAIFSLSSTFEKRNQTEKQRILLKSLVEVYPDSPLVKRARLLLELTDPDVAVLKVDPTQVISTSSTLTPKAETPPEPTKEEVEVEEEVQEVEVQEEPEVIELNN